MLLVKTKLGTSKINGIGLYADQFIPKDTVIWKFNPSVDIKFHNGDYAELKKQTGVDSLEKYIYRSKISNCYILCSDDARFTNHSSNPNTLDTMDDIEGLTIANRDIQPGEEITSDYSLFDEEYDSYKHLLK